MARQWIGSSANGPVYVIEANTQRDAIIAPGVYVDTPASGRGLFLPNPLTGLSAGGSFFADRLS